MEVDAAGLQGEDLLSVRFERSLEVKSVEAGRKIVRFHLVSSQGKEYVAACGEDYGGSHYHYYAMPDFAAHFPFRGHNKRDVGAWMDSVIKGSQERNPPAPVSAAPPPLPTVLEPPPPPMVEQPMLQPHLEQPGFIDPSQGQFYSQQGPGEGQQPGILNIQHAHGTGSKKAPKKRPAATPGGGGSKSSRSGANKNAGVKHRLTGVAHEAHIKRLKRIAAESQEVLRASQAAFLMRLRRQAALEATHREGAKQLTACWVRGDPSEDEAAVLSQWLKTLKDLLNNANKKQLQTLQYIEVELPLKTGEMMDMAPRIDFRDVPSTSSLQQGREGATDPMMVMTYGPPTHAAPSQHPSSTNGPTTAGAGTGGGSDGGGGVSGVSGVSGEVGGVGHAEAGHSRGEPHPQQQPAAASASASASAANPEAAKQEAPEKEVVQGDREEKLRSWPCSHGLPGKVVEASTWSYTEPYLHKHGLRLVLECLRELGALCFPMKPMAEHNVIGTVRAYAETHPHPAVTRLAHQLLGRWQRAALQHVALLTSPEALRDPVRELERKIAFDQVVYPDDIQAKQQVLEAQEALLKATIANPAGSAASSLHHTNSLLDSLPSMPPEAAMELLSGRVDPSISAMEGTGFPGASAGTPAMPSYHGTAAPDALGPGGSTQAAGAGTQVQGYGEVAGFGGVGSGVPFAPGPGLFPGSAAAAAFPVSGAKGLPYGSAQQQGGLADFFMMDAE